RIAVVGHPSLTLARIVWRTRGTRKTVACHAPMLLIAHVGVGAAASASELPAYLVGEKSQVFKVREVQQLQIHSLHADVGELAQLIDNLVGRARQRRIRP